MPSPCPRTGLTTQDRLIGAAHGVTRDSFGGAPGSTECCAWGMGASTPFDTTKPQIRGVWREGQTHLSAICYQRASGLLFAVGPALVVGGGAPTA